MKEGKICTFQILKEWKKKYLLSENDYNHIMSKLNQYLEKDPYYKSTICNIYFDTEKFDLIQSSLEKPIYKEKVRLRSYGIPQLDDTVFLEIKKKYKGVVGKRRIQLKLSEFYDYLEKHNIPNCNKQILEELDYCFKHYNLQPKVFIAYDRLSYYSKENREFRITFDTNIRSRYDNLRLELGDSGNLYFQDKRYIMEVKTLDSFPMWFTKILEGCHIYPDSFSKYGNIYSKKIKGEIYV